MIKETLQYLYMHITTVFGNVLYKSFIYAISLQVDMFVGNGQLKSNVD